MLDLGCNAGGCSAGYHRAGFDVVGVDHLPQPRYPFLDVIQADLLDVLSDAQFVREFAVVHVSPPCQAYTTLHAQVCRGVCQHPRLIEPTRQRLIELGVPYVIENVVGAPLRDPIMLCGSMFGLGLDGAVLRRHRLFESNLTLVAPDDACSGKRVVGVYGTGGAWTRVAPGGGGTKVSGADAAAAMGIDWTAHQDNLREMIPPAYTEWIGRQLIEQLGEVAA